MEQMENPNRIVIEKEIPPQEMHEGCVCSAYVFQKVVGNGN